MTLPAGTRLGPYEILSPLGAGGMGEVYKARDTRLDRDVAIKVLPQSVAGDAAALARFEREAKAVAALSHPNILAIHDVGTSDGVTYAVMELLEGESLRQRFQGGPLPQRKALEIAREVALGLAAAHERGIVHRDLKPENLFVTSDGRVKILDFGLARQLSLPSADDTHSPTAAQATEPGTVFGTVGYMAPEQLRGHPADARSDIFSFGAVLYEMCSGRRPFKGDTAIETMNAILKEDPPELSESGHAVAPSVERIVRHCLEKNPGERFQSARDLAFDLASLSGLSTSGASVQVGAVPSRRRLAAPALAAAALALVAGGALGGWLLSRRASTAQEVSFHRLTFRRGNILSARFAPDGQTVAYGAAWEGAPAEIFTVRTEGTESRPLGLSKADVGSISSKGELAILLKNDEFFTPNTIGTLARVPLNGGTPREVLEDAFCASWAPNGEDLAVVRRSATGRQQLEYPVGKTLGKTLDQAPYLEWVKVSPGGDLVAVAESDSLGLSIGVFDSKGGKRTPVSGLTEIMGLAWSPRGDEILYCGGPTPRQQALRAVSLDGRGRVLLPGNYLVHDVSSTGRILVEKSDFRTGLLCLPRGESREREVSWLNGSFVRDISPDGQRVLFTELGVGQGPKIGAFLRRSDGAPAVRLGDGFPLSLSEDGKLVLTLQSGPARLVLLPTGAGSPKPIPVAGVEPTWGEFLPGGNGFLVSVLRNGLREFLVVPPEGGQPRPIPIPDSQLGGGWLISPDGDRFLYVATDRSIRIVPFAGGEARKAPGAPLEREDFPVQWDADGRTLYVWRRGSLPAAVDKLDLTTGRRLPWKQLMPADLAGVISIREIAVSRDGGAYAYSYARVTSSDLYVVDGLR